MAAWIGESDRVVALTGAGISTDSGIPDFRGPGGVWTRNPAAERMSTLENYLSDPEVRRASWRDRLASPAWLARPNAGHQALVRLERMGKLDALLTQNIDGLHQQAGNDPDRVVELHGTMRWAQCWSCGHRSPMPVVLERVRSGEGDPDCDREVAGARCGGILKSATISFGQALDPSTLRRADEAASSCQLLLAVGSSLTVHPAASVVPLAHSSGARVVIVNAEPTPYDDVASAVLRGQISHMLPAVVDR